MSRRTLGSVVVLGAVVAALSGCGAAGAVNVQSTAASSASGPTLSAAPPPEPTAVTVTQTLIITSVVTVTVHGEGSTATSAVPPTSTPTTVPATATPLPHPSPTSVPGSLPVTDASQVVLDFLASLEKTPSGANSTQYLSQQLRAQVQGGRPVLTILGIQNVPTAYHVDPATSRAGGHAATVRTTLAFGSGTLQRLFTLVPEGGAWKIDDVAESNA